MHMHSPSPAEEEALRHTCVFCQRQYIAQYILKETDNFRLIIDYAPLVAGHLLITPIAHYPCYGAVPAELDAELAALKTEVQHFFHDYYAEPLYWEHGVFHQTVFHAHLHCLPLGALTYPEALYRHQLVMHSQEDLRHWYHEHGHYFYMGDATQGFIFAPNNEDYTHIAQNVMGAQVRATTGDTRWRTPTQRREEGTPLIREVSEKWAAFEQEQKRATKKGL